MKTTEKNRLSKSRDVKTQPPTEEEQDQYSFEQEMRRQEEAFANEVKNLTKAELIQLVREARDETDKFSSWLLRNNWETSHIKKQLRQIRIARQTRIDNQTKKRNEIALKKVAQTSEAQAIGVSDYYALLGEAILQYDQLVLENRRPKGTQAKAVQAIIVNRLCTSNLSVHSYSEEEWRRVVKANVDSKRIGVARNRQKKISE